VHTLLIENLKERDGYFLITNPMQKSPVWKANNSSASEEITRILWNLKIHYRIPKRYPIPNLKQLIQFVSPILYLEDTVK
jgi:hypothetical protein